MPMITALGLALLGLLLLYSALTGGWRTQEERDVTPDRPALLWIGAGLVLNVLLIGTAGFTIASDHCLRLRGARLRLAGDPARCGIGAAFALVAYFGFAQSLGINIGAGIVETAIERVFGIAPST